jgi:uncharacterized damage-inducible protein DinB
MKTLLSDAFDHHVWATLGLIDACRSLTPDHLEVSVPGTYGSILDTVRHLVGADGWYLHVITAGRIPEDDTDDMELTGLRALMARNGDAWAELLAGPLDPSADVTRQREDGSSFHAPLGIRLAQALHHGSDHRSQICTALTLLGVEPPAIDVWDFGAQEGRTVELPAPAQ